MCYESCPGFEPAHHAEGILRQILKARPELDWDDHCVLGGAAQARYQRKVSFSLHKRYL